MTNNAQKRLGVPELEWLFYMLALSKKDGKSQETTQSSATPDPGWESNKIT